VPNKVACTCGKAASGRDGIRGLSSCKSNWVRGLLCHHSALMGRAQGGDEHPVSTEGWRRDRERMAPPPAHGHSPQLTGFIGHRTPKRPL
jgi:hypothetical protein